MYTSLLLQRGESEQQGTKKMRSARACSAVSVIMDVLLWITLTILTMLLAYNLLGITPTRRGFFCDDESIRYPYRDDSVSDTMAALSSAGIPVLIMILIEAVHIVQSKEKEIMKRTELLRKYIVRVYKSVGSFLTGCACMLLLVEVLKMSAGRLRPNFISVCDPDFSKFNCSHGYVMQGEDFCRNTDTKRVLDSRKSFPSGHAALALYGAVYLLVYFQARFVWRRVALVVPILQLVDMCWGGYVSVSRVTDNKHHATDVLAGAIIGGVLALFTIKYLSQLPRMTRSYSLLPEVVSSNGIVHKCHVTSNGDAVVEMNTVQKVKEANDQ